MYLVIGTMIVVGVLLVVVIWLARKDWINFREWDRELDELHNELYDEDDRSWHH